MLERHIHLSGSERIERLTYLSKEGNEVYLIAANFEKDCYKKNDNMHLISIPLKYKPLISSLFYGLSLFFFMPFYLAKVRPDFVVTDVSPAPFLVWKPLISRALKFKLILDLRSTPVNPYGVRGHLGNLSFGLAVLIAKKMFDGMTIVTPMMRDEICRVFYINPEWVGILSNGVSDEFLKHEDNSTERADLRRKLGLDNKFVIIYHGSLRPNGGLAESIKAIALIKKSYPDIVLLLLGADPKNASFWNSTIRKNCVQDKVVLHGSVDFHDVPAFISASDVGLVPLPNIPIWRYQQPLKLLEYMAMEKTIIVSESPAHRSVADSHKNSIYVANVNPDEIAEAMMYAYKNRNRLEEWGRIGREIVMKKYAWKRVNEDLMSYLSRVQLRSD